MYDPSDGYCLFDYVNIPQIGLLEITFMNFKVRVITEPVNKEI